MSETVVFTDGSCLGNPGPGGWAWLAVQSPRIWRSGSEPWTTNQRMELAAVLDAVQTFEGDLMIVTDSMYVVNAFQKRWWAAWLDRGWKNSKGQVVAHRDLWETLVRLYRDDQDRVRFRWVKGHSQDVSNDFVDVAAKAAAHAGHGDYGFVRD